MRISSKLYIVGGPRCRLITYWPARSICISGAIFQAQFFRRISKKFETRIARQRFAWRCGPFNVGRQLRCRAARFARGMGPDKVWQSKVRAAVYSWTGHLPCAHGPSRAASSMLPYVREANERTTGWINGPCARAHGNLGACDLLIL